jgi:hypothetical protein
MSNTLQLLADRTGRSAVFGSSSRYITSWQMQCTSHLAGTATWPARYNRRAQRSRGGLGARGAAAGSLGAAAPAAGREFFFAANYLKNQLLLAAGCWVLSVVCC